MKSKFLSIIVIVAALLAPQAMQADTAAQIVSQINSFTGGGSGTLTATPSGNTVTVTGTLTDVDEGLNLTLDDFVTVVWKATISSDSSFPFSEILLTITNGAFKISDGAAITVQGYNIYAVQLISTMGTVEGGTVTAIGNNTYGIYVAHSSILTVTGGEITAGENAVFCIAADALLTISGGTIASPHYAIVCGMDNATVNVSGGTISGGWHAIYCMGQYSEVNVSGGIVQCTNNHAIREDYTNSSINLSGGAAFAYGTGVHDVVYLGNTAGVPSITGEGTVIAWNQAAGVTVYDKDTSDDLFSSPADVAKWDINGSGASAQYGISYTNGSNSGFIPLDVVVNGHAAVDNLTSALINVFSQCGNITIDSPYAETIRVYSVLGNQIYSCNKTAGKYVLPALNLTDGIYIVEGSSGWSRKITN